VKYTLTTKVRVYREKKNNKVYKRYVIVLPREIGVELEDALVEVTIKPVKS